MPGTILVLRDSGEQGNKVLAFVECSFYCKDNTVCVNSKTVSGNDRCYTDSKLDNGVESNEMSLVKGEVQAVGGTEKRPGRTR